MSDTPRVTVVIPCFNLGAYLDAAVQSVLEQTYRDFEIIVIDDGSTDRATRHLFDSYSRPGTRVLRTENRGLAAARNLGIAEARGRYVSCLDADDQLEKLFLERTVAVLDGDPSLAFASCWLTAFGELVYDWRPERAAFPDLLVEDSVCTAALMRREAVLAVGGYDVRMPVAGYEDWDLAIGLVGGGRSGTIVREPLFRYRVRRGSMAWHCGTPENHSRLMAYLVDKHAELYRTHLEGVLDAIERRALVLEGFRPSTPTPSIPAGEALAAVENPRVADLERRIAEMQSSRSWRLTAPLRAFARLVRGGRSSDRGAPRLSAVLLGDGTDDPTAIADLAAELGPADELVLVVARSVGGPTRAMLESLPITTTVVEVGDIGVVAACARGLAAARGELVVALGPAQRAAPGWLKEAVTALSVDDGLEFAVGGLLEADFSGHLWMPAGLERESVVGTTRWAFPVVRRACVLPLEGTLGSFEAATFDFVLGLVEAGRRGLLRPRAAAHAHLRRAALSALPAVVGEVVPRHEETFRRHWRPAILGQENQRRRVQASTLDRVQALSPAVAEGAVNWGSLRRLHPVSDTWGLDRGSPVDRFAIDRFLAGCAGDIRGHAMEIKENYYLDRFGTDVRVVEIVDIATDNPHATRIADLTQAGSLPDSLYDCAVVTQTLHVIYDMPAVLRNLHRALRPGGVLLATLPSVSRIDYESGLDGDFWRVTAACCKRLFSDAFPGGEVTVYSYGNVLTCCAFLLGLAAEELSPEEHETHDPYFPLIFGVRARKAPAGPGGAG